MQALMIMCEPFEIRRTFARIRALLRRTAADRVKVLEFADLKLDSSTRQAFVAIEKLS